jgi:hypothetical protein
LLALRLRKMVGGVKQQIKLSQQQKFLLTGGSAQRGRWGPKVKNFSVRIGVA